MHHFRWLLGCSSTEFTHTFFETLLDATSAALAALEAWLWILEACFARSATLAVDAKVDALEAWSFKLKLWAASIRPLP